jgi:hypothetical protein
MDVDDGIIRVFDKAWYLQPSRPPVAQLFYDLGLQDDTELIVLVPAMLPFLAPLPQCAKTLPAPPPIGPT